MTLSRHSLRQRLVRAFWIYLMLLGIGVLGFSLLLHEKVEAVVWQSLLEAEMDHFLDRGNYQRPTDWPATETLQLYRLDADAPASLAALDPGLHDEMNVEGRQSVVLVKAFEGQLYALALDIDDLEASEVNLGIGAVGIGLLLTGVLGLLMVLGINRLFAPLLRLGRQIAELDPAAAEGRVEVDAADSQEVAAIGKAVNHLLQRQFDLIKREREFLQTAGHELHTPLTVIAGALEVVEASPENDPRRQQALRRIAETARQSTQLVHALLLLGESPESLARSAGAIELPSRLAHLLVELGAIAAQRGAQIVLQVDDDALASVQAPSDAFDLLLSQLLLLALRDGDGDVCVRLGADRIQISHRQQQLSAEAAADRFRRSVHKDGGLSGLLSRDLLLRLATQLGWQLLLQPPDADDPSCRCELRLLSTRH